MRFVTALSTSLLVCHSSRRRALYTFKNTAHKQRTKPTNPTRGGEGGEYTGHGSSTRITRTRHTTHSIIAVMDSTTAFVYSTDRQRVITNNALSNPNMHVVIFLFVSHCILPAFTSSFSQFEASPRCVLSSRALVDHGKGVRKKKTFSFHNTHHAHKKKNRHPWYTSNSPHTGKTGSHNPRTITR